MADALRISTGVVAVRLSDIGEPPAPGPRRPAPEQRAPAEYSRAQADTLTRVQDLVSQIVGANTKVQINRRENGPGFQYKAVNVETGEVVAEWPFDADADREGDAPLIDRRV